MISDEPNEDADLLDDEAALDTYLGDTAESPATGTQCLPDWPPLAVREIGLSLDAETVAWFKASHADWRRAMRCVLRAWATTNRTTSPPLAPAIGVTAPMADDLAADPA